MNLLLDTHAQRVLAAIFNVPRAAKEVSDRADLPIASVYRTLRELEARGFVQKTGGRTVGGQRALYVSLVRSIEIRFRNGEPEVHVVRKEGAI